MDVEKLIEESRNDSQHSAIDSVTEEFSSAAWIDGSPYDQTDETFDTYAPAVNQPIMSVPQCDASDVDTAVAAAREAFENEWGDRSPSERSAILLEWLEALEKHSDELALLNSIDVGKPLGNARLDVQSALEFFEYTATVVRGQQDERLQHTPDNHIYTRNEPYGVVGQILPWNYPTLLAAWKVTPALAAGNTVVLKSSEEAPLSMARFAQLSEDILPDGVFNVVHGFGDEAGAPLVEHDDVNKLSFTGSVATGRKVMKTASERITPVTLELGGKSPFVVFPDADLDMAAESAAAGIFYNQGQSCDACSRVIVHQDIHDEFVDRFLKETDAYTPGDPLDPSTTLGPLAFKGQYEKVTNYIDIGKEEGATLIAGGESPEVNGLEEGWYVEPTVFDDVSSDMRIAQEEIFGPVQTILTFEDYDEAIRLANDSEYGLVAGVATEDPSVAHRAAADIEAGSVYVNQYFGTIPGMPFGGFKNSGIGRECAQQTLNEYTQTKSVNIALSDPSL